MKKFVNTIAALSIALGTTFSAGAKADKSCWDGVASVWPAPNFLGVQPMYINYFESSEGIVAFVQLTTMAHCLILTQVSGSINGQSWLTTTTNEFGGGLQGTTFAGRAVIPQPLLCGMTNNWIKVESWLYEPGVPLWSDKFWSKASVKLKGN